MKFQFGHGQRGLLWGQLAKQLHGSGILAQLFQGVSPQNAILIGQALGGDLTKGLCGLQPLALRLH